MTPPSSSALFAKLSLNPCRLDLEAAAWSLALWRAQPLLPAGAGPAHSAAVRGTGHPPGHLSWALGRLLAGDPGSGCLQVRPCFLLQCRCPASRMLCISEFAQLGRP